MSQEFIFNQNAIQNQLKKRAHGSIFAVVSVFVVLFTALLLFGFLMGTYPADLAIMSVALILIFLVISIPVFINARSILRLVDKVPKRFIIAPNGLFIDGINYDIRNISEIRLPIPHRGLFSGKIRKIRLIYHGQVHIFCLGSYRAPWTKNTGDVCPQYERFYFAVVSLYPEKIRNTSYM